ncbi:MAG: hypothetical protein MI700_10800 [Balneolales bacterium]|nr:hypothetical protein [Balneolales bacterium]
MENWKDKVIGSLEGLERATPPADAFRLIQEKIAHQNIEKKSLSRMHVAAVAAAILIAVTTNIFVISNYDSDAESTGLEEQTEYTSILSNYNLYEL